MYTLILHPLQEKQTATIITADGEHTEVTVKLNRQHGLLFVTVDSNDVGKGKAKGAPRKTRRYHGRLVACERNLVDRLISKTGLSQDELAEQLGCDPTTLSRIRHKGECGLYLFDTIKSHLEQEGKE